METQDVISALSALAQESRLAVFRLLVQAGPAGVAAGEIARRLDVSPPTLSFHLRLLSHARLVTARRDGRSVHYSANFDAMSELLAYMTENCCGGEPGACTPVVDRVSPRARAARRSRGAAG